VKIHSHYDNLKVSRDAPQEVIRAAYRTLCQKYHPDRRLDDPDAERVMKIINASYAVLSDPAQRKEHDDWLARKEREAGASKASSARASSSSSGTSQSSFNAAAAAAAAAQQSASASKGRTSPPRSSQRASGWSSTARVDPRAAQGAHGKRERTRNPSGFSLRKISLRSWIVIGICGFFGYVAITESTTPWPFTRNTTGYDSAYGARSRTDSALAADAADAADKRRALTALSTAHAATSPWAHDVSTATSDAGNAGSVDRQHEPFVRPTVAPNGSPWPAKASYLEGMPVGASDGHSSVTIDNSSNSFDVFGKLVYNASVFDQPVRHFFIPAGQTFTLTDVAPGNYDIRYQNLADGGMFKSQNFGLFEQDGGIGAKASNVSIMLYGSPDSNVQATSIGRGEF